MMNIFIALGAVCLLGSLEVFGQVCVPGTNAGCSNDGVCYNNSRFGFICSCKYGWSPPTCATPGNAVLSCGFCFRSVVCCHRCLLFGGWRSAFG
jgi:hypothetical protein